MVYLLKIVIFHGYVSHNQMVYPHYIPIEIPGFSRQTPPLDVPISSDIFKLRSVPNPPAIPLYCLVFRDSPIGSYWIIIILNTLW